MPQKYCRKFEPPEQGARALQTDRRQTTDRHAGVRAIEYSEREREFTFAKNVLVLEHKVLVLVFDDKILTTTRAAVRLEIEQRTL